jgi:formylglycine-generating enzyme required for sulfatase activity
LAKSEFPCHVFAANRPLLIAALSGVALFMLVAANKTLTTGASVNLFQSAVVCIAVIAMCGCDQGQPTPPVASNPTPVAKPEPAFVATNVEDMELPESAESIGMEFELIPAGTFTMGEGDKAHGVTLTKSFKMGVHEVTQAQYEQVMGVNPSHFKGANNPVEMVSWNDAVEFCRKLSELPSEKAAGHVYRLPTEAEWEYACRAGTTTKFSFGDDGSEAGDYAWYNDNANHKTHPVGSKQPNAWGLYDMHANASEWCQDWKEDYPAGAVTDPTGPASASYRVFRGGCWDLTAELCRSAYRYRDYPTARYNNLGFRVCLSPSGK